jgi:hypothetical protein
MQNVRDYVSKQSFELFERAAAKGHEESIWIVSVLKDVEMKKSALMEAFAKTEEPLGWWFMGLLSDEREEFDFYKKSAEGGCSWGQVWYGMCFRHGVFVEQDEKVYVEWLEKAGNQNNPWAMKRLGDWFHGEGGDKQKAVSYYGRGAELGWNSSMSRLADMLREGEGCEKDLRQAAIWSAKGDYSSKFWDILKTTGVAFKDETTEKLDCDFDQLCYSLGWGLYWYQYETGRWKSRSVEAQIWGNRCLDYYCSCDEMQQKSIFTFLLCWNQTTRGVKGPGQMIAQMVWEGRVDNLLKRFRSPREEVPD